jgi:formylglycine-generating enzyme required for sulfatase activity
MILSDLEGLSFTSYNGIVKVNELPGKYFLFLSPDERVVEVYKTGFMTLKIILRDHGIKLASGQTWQVKVTGEKKSDLISITLRTKPEGAKILIDGVDKGTNPTQEVTLGTHELVVEKAGYLPYKKTIEVSRANIFFEISLKEVDMASVQIKTIPAGAQIFIDNVDKGKTDKGLFLYPGAYRIKISLSGYLDVDKEIEVVDGKENTFSFPLTKNVGTLTLTVLPADATVLINKEDYSNKNDIQLSPGKYKIEISRQGYNDTSETFVVELGKNLKKSFTLKQKVGKLLFTINPLQASVELKQKGVTKYNWNGMKQFKDLPIGEYDLECSASGFQSITKKVTIAENKTEVEDIILTKTLVSTGKLTQKTSSKDNMVYVEGGWLEMGSNDGESDEKPVHRVYVDGFYIDKTEVTQAEYEKVMGTNPSSFKCSTCPVENVSWNDAVEYAKKVGKRLPTEAEWEYAARGGNKSKAFKYSGSNSLDEVGWYDSNSENKTHPVGTKQPNELGIYDMSGNVWEWCLDWYGENYYGTSPDKNPQGPSSGTYRVLRGGSWYSNDVSCRLTNRIRYNPDLRNINIGFRCVENK